MRKLRLLALPLLVAMTVVASIPALVLAEGDTVAPTQAVARYILHVDGMT